MLMVKCWKDESAYLAPLDLHVLALLSGPCSPALVPINKPGPAQVPGNKALSAIYCTYVVIKNTIASLPRAGKRRWQN